MQNLFSWRNLWFLETKTTSNSLHLLFVRENVLYSDSGDLICLLRVSWLVKKGMKKTGYAVRRRDFGDARDSLFQFS